MPTNWEELIGGLRMIDGVLPFLFPFLVVGFVVCWMNLADHGRSLIGHGYVEHAQLHAF